MSSALRTDTRGAVDLDGPSAGGCGASGSSGASASVAATTFRTGTGRAAASTTQSTSGSNGKGTLGPAGRLASLCARLGLLRTGETPRAKALRFGQVVAADYEQPLVEIVGRSTMRCFVEPRFVLCWLLRASGDTWSSIERSTGVNRVGARIGVAKLERQMFTDRALEQRVTALVARVAP